jgi:molecular chaperone GrpE
MMFQNNLLISTLLLSMKFSVDAFSVIPSSRASTSVQKLQLQSPQLSNNNNNRFITSLYAEEGEAEEKAAEDEKKSGDGGDDILNSPAFLKRKLEVLKSDVESLDERMSSANEVYLANKAEWGPQLDDLRKEYTNIQDRMKQKMKDGAGAANIQIARGILNVLDNYDRAFASVNAETDEQKAVEATYKETYDMILAKFEELGVHAVDTVGKEFDYEFHSAVMMRPDEDYEEGIVCEELAKGFAMEDGTLIRAAMVVVAA